ncbi:MAG: hypothetical protein MZV64_27475 [Ignavibacteriales bacterium]|nr:hypothetical protein [Ignavibacteriales bacterium]
MLFSLILFLVITYIAHYGYFFALDNSIINYLMDLTRRYPLDYLVFITDLGSAFFILGIAAILFIKLALNNRYKEGLMLLFASVGGILISYGAKLIFERVRPEIQLHLVFTDTYSYPSGHAMAAICFYEL